MSSSPSSEIKLLVDRICSRHDLTQRDVATQVDVSYATLKNWMSGRSQCSSTAQMALEGLAQSYPALDGNDVLDHCYVVLTGFEERRLCAAWAACGDEFLNYIKDWSNKDLIEFAQHSQPSDGTPDFFNEVVLAQLIDEEGENPFDDLSESALNALTSRAKVLAAPVVAMELADRLADVSP